MCQWRLGNQVLYTFWVAISCLHKCVYIQSTHVFLWSIFLSPLKRFSCATFLPKSFWVLGNEKRSKLAERLLFYFWGPELKTFLYFRAQLAEESNDIFTMTSTSMHLVCSRCMFVGLIKVRNFTQVKLQWYSYLKRHQIFNLIGIYTSEPYPYRGYTVNTVNRNAFIFLSLSQNVNGSLCHLWRLSCKNRSAFW